MVAAGLDDAEDYIEPLVWIVLINAHLKIRGLTVIEKVRRAPFDVKNAVGGAA